MDFLQQIVARAKANKQRIILPEATEERTLKAADRVLADDIADIILIGNPDEINKLAAEWGLNNIGKATIIDPLTTGDTLRPALQIIKCAPGISCVSGGMILVSKAKEIWRERVSS
jgi:phosphotransacetylase